MSYANELAIFAERRAIPADQVFVLAALFTYAAEQAGVPVRVLITRATYEEPVGQYMAKLAAEVAAKAA